MKSKWYLIVLLTTTLLSWQCYPIEKKAAFILLIDEPTVFKSPTKHGDSIVRLQVKAWIYNNTDDTLVYSNWWGQESKFYKTDNENLIVTNDEFWHKQPAHPDTVWPHSSRSNFIYFDFKKIPDTNFNFRIGMRLLKWQKIYKTTDPDLKAFQQASVLWSDIELVKTDRKHHNYWKTPKEYKQECEKVVDPLTDNDRANYTLSIALNKIRRLRDTVAWYLDTVVDEKGNKGLRGKKDLFAYTIIPLKITNNSDSTLTYMTWTCSWDEMYQTNNKKVSLMSYFCTKNITTTIDISAHSSYILNIPMLFDKQTPPNKYKFKIGLVLLRSGSVPFFAFAESLPLFKQDPKYLIWSNEVEIPAKK